jgi:hypothetical protein
VKVGRKGKKKKNEDWEEGERKDGMKVGRKGKERMEWRLGGRRMKGWNGG